MPGIPAIYINCIYMTLPCMSPIIHNLIRTFYLLYDLNLINEMSNFMFKLPIDSQSHVWKLKLLLILLNNRILPYIADSAYTDNGLTWYLYF